MSGMDGGEAIQPDEAFRLLGNERRIDILQALWEHVDPEQGTLDGASPVPFSRLRESAGIDDSGNFNYHLGQLTGTLVTESEDGYALSQLGVALMRAIDTGTSFAIREIEPTPLSEPCPFCGAELRGSYANEDVTVACTGCAGLERNGVIYEGRAPSAGLEGRTIREVVDAALARDSAFDTLAEEGVCPDCSAKVDVALVACSDHAPGEGLCPTCDRRFGARSRTECASCGTTAWSPALTHLTDVPSVRSFFGARGVDVDRSLSLEFLLGLHRHVEETIRAVDPVAVTYEVTVDGDWLRGTVEADPDGTPTVVVETK